MHRKNTIIIGTLGFVMFMFTCLPVYSQMALIQIDASSIEDAVKPFLGVNAGPFEFGEPENTHLPDQYRDLGINMVRTHGFQGPLDFKTIYPNETADPSDPASFNFHISDVAAQMIHDNGHEIYFRIGNSPNYEGTPPIDIPNYIEATKNIIKHYTQGLWDGFEFPIQYIEIWNEPKNREFWTGSTIEFLMFFEQMAKELKAEFPDMKIGGPAFLPTGYVLQEFPPQFLEHCRDHNVPLDFLSWHIYTDDPTMYYDAGIYYRQLLDEYGYTEAESHITEWNTNESPLRYNAAGAAIMTSGWINLQKAPVDISIIHRGQDPSMDHIVFYGIMYADGTYKKIGYAFKGWSRLADEYTQRISAIDDGDMIDVLAAMNEDQSSIAILMSHYTQFTSDGNGQAVTLSDGKDSYQLDISGWEPGGPVQVTRYLVNDTHSLEIAEDQLYNTLDEFTTQSQLFPDDTVEFIFITQSATSSVQQWDQYE